MAGGQFDAEFNTVASADLLTEFGESITYTPDGESAISTTAAIDRHQFRTEQEVDGEGYNITAAIVISTAAIAVPAVNDAVTFDSESWIVSEVEPADGTGLATLTVYRHVASETGKSDYRIQRR